MCLVDASDPATVPQLRGPAHANRAQENAGRSGRDDDPEQFRSRTMFGVSGGREGFEFFEQPCANLIVGLARTLSDVNQLRERPIFS